MKRKLHSNIVKYGEKFKVSRKICSLQGTKRSLNVGEFIWTKKKDEASFDDWNENNMK